MAFIATSSHYEYSVMLYGLSGAPSIFQNLISDALKDKHGKLFLEMYSNLFSVLFFLQTSSVSPRLENQLYVHCVHYLV